MKKTTLKLKRDTYPLSQSPLYRLRTKTKLAALLDISKADLFALVSSAQSAGAYREWATRAKYPDSKHPVLAHKPRKIQEPIGNLREAQDRLCNLLARINLPNYLHSARKGRSYRTNAGAHDGPGCAFRIDIKRFYQSVRAYYVEKFFLETMQCNPDVAHLLTEITCFRGGLPTGSPLSPIISFMAYSQMFDQLYCLAQSVNATMTVYVDDVVFSGLGVTGDLIRQSRAILRNFELIGHKIEFYGVGETRIVTGVAVDEEGTLGVTNKRRRKIRALMEERARATDPDEKRRYSQSLVGLLRESSTLDKALSSIAQRIEREDASLHEKL